MASLPTRSSSGDDHDHRQRANHIYTTERDEEPPGSRPATHGSADRATRCDMATIMLDVWRTGRGVRGHRHRSLLSPIALQGVPTA